MKRKLSLLTFGISLLLTACGVATQVPPTTTRTLTPTIQHTTTSTPTRVPTHVPSQTPTPATVCGTPLSPETQSGALSDEQIYLEFVGKYYAGLMEVAFYTLVIQCDHSFELETGYDFAVEHTWGQVEMADGLLKLLSAGWTTELVPIRWGPRRYLVSAETVSDFCAAVQSGAEPRQNTVRVDFLRGVEIDLKVTGDPILPSGEKVCP